MLENADNTLKAAQATVEQILLNTSVESFGIMNQTLFIDFRNEEGEDNRLIINSIIKLSNYVQLEKLGDSDYYLLCMNKINLCMINKVECKLNQELYLHFADGRILYLLPNEENIEEDQWQLNTSLRIAEGGKSVIALVGGGYAVW